MFFRQQQYLQQQGVPAPGGPSPAGIPHGIQKTPDRNIVGSPGVGGSPRKVKKAKILLAIKTITNCSFTI